jgi:hypothetical protein
MLAFTRQHRLHRREEIGILAYMGLLDFIFCSKTPSNCEVVADRIWRSTDAKFVGIAKETAERANSETVAILLVAHFPDVLARLHEVASATTRVPVKAVLATSLTPDLAASLKLDESSVIDIIVGERHPLLSVDERLEEFAGAFPCRCRFSHHLSLDDPVMQVFSSGWVKQVLSKLGMKEDEAIESEMVVRRIKDAQRKIEGRALGNVDAESAAEWLERNCPGLGQK